MLIIAGALHVDPDERGRYLEAVEYVTRNARETPGCLDFMQAPDPIDAGRINIFERWESDEDLHRFRGGVGPEGAEIPAIRAAEVHKYRISAVEAP